MLEIAGLVVKKFIAKRMSQEIIQLVFSFLFFFLLQIYF